MRWTVPALLVLTAGALAVLPLRADEPSAVPPERIDALVEQLGSPDFELRERASRELLALGEQARPALQHTMMHSENMEARWRAEQILRRLDREGERRIQGEPRTQPPRPGRAPGGVRPGLGWTELERQIEEFRRRLEERFGGFGFQDAIHRIEAPGLTLDVSTFGLLAHLRLHVEGRARPYHGRTLEEILRRYPELADLPGMPALKEKWEAFKEERPALFPFERTFPRLGPDVLFRSFNQGVEITQGPDGVRVRITEKDENGEDVVTEYEGESLEQLRRDVPELREKLRGFGFSIQVGPTQVFREPPRRRLPLPPAPVPAPTTPTEKPPALFGVEIVSLEPVLATHLGLEDGTGVLVHRVVPGSQAEALGLKRYDVIVSLDGQPARDLETLRTALGRIARERAAMTLEIIRQGEHQTLSR